MYSGSKFGGKTESVVETARHAREERAQQKRKEAAAITIQSVARSFLCRHTLGLRWRKELDLMIGRKPKEDLKKEEKSTNIRTDVNKTVEKTSTISAIDKIPAQSKQRSEAEWQFASFGSNTLIGAYGNLSMTSKKTVNSERYEKVVNKLDDGNKADVISHASKENSNELETPEKVDFSQQEDFPPKRVSNQDIFYAIRKFLHMFQSEKDRDRFVDLCRYLLHNTESESSTKNSYVCLCVHKQLVLPWISQIKTILWQCCKYLDASQTKNIHSYEDGSVCPITVFLRMLIVFTDVAHWKPLKKQKALHRALAQICSNICCDIYNRGCLCVLGSMMKHGITSSLSNNSIVACIEFVFRLLAAKNFSDDPLVAFMLMVMTVPSLMWQLNERLYQCLALFKQHEMLSRILTLFHDEDTCSSKGLKFCHCEDFSSITDCLCILANLVQLCIIENETMEQKKTEVVALSNYLLKFLCTNAMRDRSSSSTWHPVLGYFAENKMRSSNTEAMRYVKKQLEFLWDSRFVCVAFHDVLNLPALHDDNAIPSQAEQLAAKLKPKTTLSVKLSSFLKKAASSRSQKILLPTGGRKLEYSEVKNTCTSCLMYRRALTIVTKQLQLEMLTGLTFLNELLSRMWVFICELGPSGGFQLFLSALAFTIQEAEPYFAVFTLFCDMTSHVLSILDDIEFYELQIPFHLEELVTISAALRQFVFKVIWGGLVKDNQSGMYPVFDSAHTLLIMLYNRDARRSFTPHHHWLCKDVKASVIRSEVEKKQARAKLVLEKIPFVLPHEDRVILFRSFVVADKTALGISSDNSISAHIRVHRSRLVEDGFSQLSSLHPHAIKGVIRVRFVNDLGLDEAGIDQDGVFKEFLEEIIQKVFNPDANLFKVTTGGESKLYPSPQSHLEEDHILMFTFIGRMLGKAVYEGIVLDIPFANFFLRDILAQQYSKLYSPLDELPSLDAEFFKNLTWIKRYDGDICDLGLTFTYEEDILGRVETHDLVPGGAAIPVTNENRIMYIHTLAHYRLHTQVRKQTNAFISGFRSIIPHSWTAIFSAPELQRLISGDNADLDLGDLKRHVVYYGGFHATHRVVKWLWNILERDYNASDRSAFLKFVTSCSRPPLLGFAHLNPKFSIRCVEVSDDEDTGDTVATVLRGFLHLPSSKGRRTHHHPHRLPTASTCFNLLKLPNYPNKDVLREKLRQAITNNTGFELS